MDRTSASGALVLAAVFLLSFMTALPPPATAQVGTSSLAGGVCSVDQDVAYIKAPDAGDPAGCGTWLANATVRLSKPGVAGTPVGAVDKSAVTDRNGSYQFGTIPDGSYTLAVERVGYAGTNLTVTVQGATARDIGLRPLDIRVQGTVKDTAGAPLPGVLVVVCCAPGIGSTQATTDGAGAFEVPTRSGERTFSVDRNGFRALSASRFVDGTQPVHLVVPPQPVPDAALHGRVTDQEGRPLAGIEVNVHSYGRCCDDPVPYASSEGKTEPASDADVAASYVPCCHGGGAMVKTDADGRYSLRLYGGSSVSVSVYREGYAGYSKSFELEKGENRTLDIHLLKFPAKTARLDGKAVDAGTGKGLRHVSVSVQSPAYGLYECSQDADAAPPTPRAQATASSGAETAVMPPVPAYGNGCAIRVGPDGSFTGNVTPGYTILQVSYDAYRACPPSEDGVYRPCQPEYYTWTQTLQLGAGQATPVTVRLQQRPAPDAVVSGYLVDAETGKAIPKAQVSFSSEDSYGYGAATTDQDGSYRIRIRSGHLNVYAYAEGHLHWAGTLDAARGETPLDIRLTPGEESNGGCCFIAAGGRGMASAVADSGAGGVAASEGTQAPRAPSAGASGTGGVFEDLRGGLGPYDATARSRTLENASGRSTPAAAPLALLALMGCALWLRRR